MARKTGENSIISKQHNRGLILQLVATGRCSSRIELSRKTRLTKMTVSNIIAEFLERGLIIECEEELTEVRGRNPIILKISPQAPKVVGLLIFRDRFEVVLSDMTLNVIKRDLIYFNDLNEDLLLEYSYKLIDKMLAFEKNILGIGVSTIGPVDIRNEIILSPPRFHGVHNINIGKLLRERYHYPVFVDHDNNSAALAEKLFGIGKNVQDFIFLGISNGIGSGIISNGEVFHNHNGYAPEIGHVSIDRNGERCVCGNRGCLEQYASTYIVLDKLKKETGKDITFKKFCSLSDNETVDTIFKEMVHDISVALISCVNILWPELIVIGHESTNLHDRYLMALEDEINRLKFNQDNRRTRVVRAHFTEDAQLLGAAANVISQAFKGNILFLK